MKKTVAFILSLALASSLSFSAFADAHSGTQTVTTTKSAPTYSLTIPADTSIPWGTTEDFILGLIKVKVSSDFDVDNKLIKLDWGSIDGEFTSTTPGVTTTIPYGIAVVVGNSNSFYYFNMLRKKPDEAGSRYAEEPFYMRVKKAAWEAAQAGDYTTTITYTASLVDSY